MADSSAPGSAPPKSVERSRSTPDLHVAEQSGFATDGYEAGLNEFSETALDAADLVYIQTPHRTNAAARKHHNPRGQTPCLVFSGTFETCFSGKIHRAVSADRRRPIPSREWPRSASAGRGARNPPRLSKDVPQGGSRKSNLLVRTVTTPSSAAAVLNSRIVASSPAPRSAPASTRQTLHSPEQHPLRATSITPTLPESDAQQPGASQLKSTEPLTRFDQDTVPLDGYDAAIAVGTTLRLFEPTLTASLAFLSYQAPRR